MKVNDDPPEAIESWVAIENKFQVAEESDVLTQQLYSQKCYYNYYLHVN